MRPQGLHGVIAPIPTPFDPETGDVAPVALRHATRALLGQGLDGIAVAGSTGEGELLDADERVKLVEWLRDVVPDDKWLIAGAGAESTRA
ncbi:MAG: dihydrodipicolinate synthase family protein, partial [Gemmatimonadota bacterium]